MQAYSLRFPFLSSPGHFGQKPHSKTQGIFSTILWTPFVPPPTLTHLLNGKAVPRPLQPQRREHGQVTAT